jgi:flagella basal body P-ring formation protein FlgA
LTATSLIPKHATIRRDDVQLRRIETTTVPQERVRLFDELVGKRTARIITTGSILSHAMLEPKPLIQRNETINLHVVAGHVAVVTKAIAKEDGLKNSVIEVQQVNRRERLKARVVAERTARIELE